jgi:hypothetical protein
MSAASGDVQWKNYYHIYQAYHEKVDNYPNMDNGIPNGS